MGEYLFDLLKSDINYAINVIADPGCVKVEQNPLPNVKQNLSISASFLCYTVCICPTKSTPGLYMS